MYGVEMREVYRVFGGLALWFALSPIPPLLVVFVPDSNAGPRPSLQQLLAVCILPCVCSLMLLMPALNRVCSPPSMRVDVE